MINEEKLKIQQEALAALKANNYKGIVILPTGTGKTFVLIEALKELYQPGMRVLYTCDSRRLRDVDFNKELIKWDAEKYIELIERQCYAGAYKLKGEHFNILLADEGDYALTPEYGKIFLNNTFDYIIFVSATLDPSKVALAKQIAPVVYRKKLKEIEERKVINKCQFVYVPYRLNDKENAKYLYFNKQFRELLVRERTAHINKQLDWLKIQRQHFLAGLESSAYICRKLLAELKFSDPNCKTLVFCGLNEQADRISPYTYHTESEKKGNLERFEIGDIDELVVCGKVNRGVNLSDVNKIIVENPKRSQTTMIQRTGRGRRLGIEDMLEVFLLIPYFTPEWNKTPRPTIVLDWCKFAAKDMGIEGAKTYILK